MSEHQGSPSFRTEAPLRSSSGLRSALREVTAAAHRELEQMPLMRKIVEGSPALDDYVDYLSRHWRLHAPLEASLRPWVTATWAAERLVKAEALAADLAQLGHSPAGASERTPHIDRPGAAWGAAYVLEGATLGLNMVTKRLPSTHPAHTEAGRFMRAYGDRTGERWAAFLLELEALDRTEWPAACKAALATFKAFREVFEEPRT
jgi:heme oxygenase (biliverdin-IX-beta and delta-forming)